MAETYEILLENAWAILRYHPTDNYIYHTFHQQISGEPFREVLNTGYEVVKEKGVQKWLSDDRKNSELSAEDVAFGERDWGPRMAAAGWRYWALVVPESLAGRSVMLDVVEGYDKIGVLVAVFTDLEQARTWLVSR